MKIHNVILATFVLLVIAGNAYAASFDCGKAASEVEKIICSDDELSRLDESLNKAFLGALKRADIKKQALESQRQWLKNERNACQNAECIRNAYETRIRKLRDGIGGRYELLKRYPTGIHEGMFEVDPSNMEVCRAYEKNLNSFPEIEHPMVCERPINPAFEEFKRFQWTELNASEQRDTVLKIDKQSPYYKANPGAMKIEQWEEELKARIAKGRIRLRLAQIEVNEIDGKPLDAPLYMLEYDPGGKCDPMSQQSLNYYSLGYEYFITDQHMDNLVRIWGELSDPFVYKNKVYFTSFTYTDWSDWFKHRLKSRQYEVWLYELMRPVGDFAAVPACRFRYIGKVPVIPSKPLE